MVAGQYGRVARRDNLLSAAPRFGFGREEANAVIDRSLNIIASEWSSAVVEQGGSKDDCEAVRGAFVYEGFELTTPPSSIP